MPSSHPTITLLEALNQHTADVLKKLAALLPGEKTSTRKNDLINYIQPYLQGESLKSLWDKCDRLQQAAIAETLHFDSNTYNSTKFVNKYGKSPKWGTSRYYSYIDKATTLDLFFYNYTMLQPADKTSSAVKLSTAS